MAEVCITTKYHTAHGIDMRLLGLPQIKDYTATCAKCGHGCYIQYGESGIRDFNCCTCDSTEFRSMKWIFE